MYNVHSQRDNNIPTLAQQICPEDWLTDWLTLWKDSELALARWPGTYRISELWDGYMVGQGSAVMSVVNKNTRLEHWA